jgi:hypothetical protein
MTGWLYGNTYRHRGNIHYSLPVIGKNLIRSENTGLLRYFPESSAA